jgi:hypothetical protein
MTSDEAAAPGGGTGGKTGPLPFDTSKAHQARIYDHLLGGKDNISQVVRETLCSALTVPIQRRDSDYSKTGFVAVRGLFRTCIGFDVRFFGWGFLTLA